MPFTNRIASGFFLAVMIAGTGCGTLRSSRLDEELRAHGLYSCEIRPVPLAPRAEPHATHLRCYRDVVEFRAPKVQWLRSYYPSVDCTGAAIGSAEWSSTLADSGKSAIDELRPSHDLKRVEMAYGDIVARKLTRISAEWFLDLRTGCNLKRLEIQTPSQVAYENPCSGLLPKRESPESRIIAFTKDTPKESPKVIQGYWDGHAQSCAR